jgi:hypothetical protein
MYPFVSGVFVVAFAFSGDSHSIADGTLLQPQSRAASGQPVLQENYLKIRMAAYKLQEGMLLEQALNELGNICPSARVGTVHGGVILFDQFGLRLDYTHDGHHLRLNRVVID